MSSGKLWRPVIWRRATIMVNSFLAIAICTIHIELSYSPPFGANTNYFIVIFKFLYLFYEEMLIKVSGWVHGVMFNLLYYTFTCNISIQTIFHHILNSSLTTFFPAGFDPKCVGIFSDDCVVDVYK